MPNYFKEINAEDIETENEIKAESVSTEDIQTKARNATVTIHRDSNGDWRANGPTSQISKGPDFATVLQASHDAVEEGESIAVQADGANKISWSQKVTFTKPLFLFGSGAKTILTDSFSDSYQIELNVDNSGTLYRRTWGIFGFDFGGNKANLSGVECIHQSGDLAGGVISRNFFRNWSGYGVNWTGHTLNFVHNWTRNMDDYGIKLGSSYNWVEHNDLDGGIFSQTSEPNWIRHNSLFAGKYGAYITDRDKLVDNEIVDNDEEGVYIESTSSGWEVRDNDIHNNSLATDGAYPGVYVNGSIDTVSDFKITDNHCWNRDPALSGSGNGLQSHGLRFEGAMADGIIKDNNLKGNETGPIEFVSYNPSNIKLKENLGYVTENGGKETQSGDGTETMFGWSHGLSGSPQSVSVDPMTADASGDFSIGYSSSQFVIEYSSAPPSGTDNLEWSWKAETNI